MYFVTEVALLTTSTVGTEIGLHARKLSWNLECCILGLVGVCLLFTYQIQHHLTIPQETIVLVVFLGGLMGITRIPFPQNWFGKPIPLWAYPFISGTLSMVMDSFLVLLLVGGAKIEGKPDQQFRFRALNMIAALIGGLGLYFGEVYALPLCLKYGMHSWHSMVPLIPPIYAYLAVLAMLSARLEIRIMGMRGLEGPSTGHPKKVHADWGDYVEFGVAILLLLITHNAWICLGVLLLYSFITGQGEDLIDVLRTETEMSVMLLLVAAAVVAPELEPLLVAYFPGVLAFIPSAVNGVLTGAIYPASGDFWFDILILSSAVLLTPISSLVGVMLFKTWTDWKQYVRFAFPLLLAWTVIAGLWIYGPWKMLLQDRYYQVFPAPSLVVPEPESDR